MRRLILPVETAARELDAKLLLALRAVDRGVEVTIGNKALLNLDIHKLEPGVYLSHNFNAGRDRIIAIARRLGHKVVAWDEEGVVWLNPASYRDRRVSAEAVAALDTIFAWGDEQAEALGPALEGLGTRLAITGNPRADLLRPELRTLYGPRAAELRAEFGDFILINSNFGWINHAIAGHGAGHEDEIEALAKRSKFPAGYLRHRFALYGAFTKALPEIARRFPGRRVVVRPHPSESDRGWKAAAEGLDNVTVRYDDELVPWLLAAGHIVHNGCTTAVETAMLGRVAVSFRPFIADGFEIPQPTAVSLDAFTVEDLLDKLATPGLADSLPEALRARLAHMVVSTTGPSASERVVEALEALYPDRPTPRASLMRVSGRAQALWRRSRKLRQKDDPSSPANPAYYGHKFPPMGAEKIAARLKPFSDLLGIATPAIDEVSDRIFRLRRS